MRVPERRSTEAKSRRPWSPLLDHVVTLTSLAGIAIYGLTRIGIDSFYDGLGVRAEEAGLTQSIILSRAAVSLFLALLVSAFVTAQFATALTRLIERRLASSESTTEREHQAQYPAARDLLDPWAFSYTIAWCVLVTFTSSLLLSVLTRKFTGEWADGGDPSR